MCLPESEGTRPPPLLSDGISPSTTFFCFSVWCNTAATAYVSSFSFTFSVLPPLRLLASYSLGQVTSVVSVLSERKNECNHFVVLNLSCPSADDHLLAIHFFVLVPLRLLTFVHVVLVCVCLCHLCPALELHRIILA